MTSISVTSVFLAFCVALATSEMSYSQQRMNSLNLLKLVLANNELAFKLHQRLASESSGNVFFSPMSISTAFAMLFYGSRGETALDEYFGICSQTPL